MAANETIYFGALIDYGPLGGPSFNGGGPLPPTDSALTRFELTLGKPASLVHVTHKWSNNTVDATGKPNTRPFSSMQPTYDALANAGRIPITDWLPWEYQTPSRNIFFQPSKIVRGDWDTYITQFATDAKAWGGPLVARCFIEPNLTGQFPWQHGSTGTWNIPATQGWGGAYTNTTADVVGAHQRIISIFKNNVGCFNVKFVWAPNVRAKTDTVTMANMYLGNFTSGPLVGLPYLDYLGWDGYARAATDTLGNAWRGTGALTYLADTYAEQAALDPSLPMMITECGIPGMPNGTVPIAVNSITANGSTWSIVVPSQPWTGGTWAVNNAVMLIGSSPSTYNIAPSTITAVSGTGPYTLTINNTSIPSGFTSARALMVDRISRSASWVTTFDSDFPSMPRIKGVAIYHVADAGSTGGNNWQYTMDVDGQQHSTLDATNFAKAANAHVLAGGAMGTNIMSKPAIPYQDQALSAPNERYIGVSDSVPFTATGLWPFGEAAGATTTADLSGNSRTGTVNGTVTFGTTGIVPGMAGTAISFPNAATGNNITVADNAAFSPATTNEFSVWGWCLWPTTATTTNTFAAKNAGSGAAEWDLSITGSQIIANARSSAANTVIAQAVGTVPTANVVHHIAMTIDTALTTAGVKLYVDGTLLASSGTWSGSMSDTTAAVTFGQKLDAGLPNPVMAGFKMQAWATSPRALSAESVADIYAAGVAAPVISSVTATTTSNSATVSASLDIPGSFIVDYGTTTGYGQSTVYDNRRIAGSRSAVVTGLTAGVLYHYRVRSRNTAGTERVGADATFTTGATGTAPYPAAVLTDLPVAYYRLGELTGTTAADSSGNARPGTYTGGFTLNAVGAIASDADAAVSLDGSTGYVTVPHNAAFNLTGNLTIEAWVYPTSRSNYQMIVTKDTANGQTTNTFELRLEQTTGIPNFLQATTTFLNVPATTAPPLNQWSFLAVTKSGTTVTHYLNGVANGSGTLGGTPTTNALPVLIGRRDDGVGSFLGRLDEVAIYGTALTSTRILAHYNASFASAGGTLSISNVQATAISTTGATFTWTTSAPADSQVAWGFDPTNYSALSSVTDTSPRVTSHSVTVGSLTSGHLYYFKVFSNDAFGNSASSSDVAFTTLGSAMSFGTPIVGVASSTSVALSWPAATGGVAPYTYQVQRAPDVLQGVLVLNFHPESKLGTEPAAPTGCATVSTILPDATDGVAGSRLGGHVSTANTAPRAILNKPAAKDSAVDLAGSTPPTTVPGGSRVFGWFSDVAYSGTFAAGTWSAQFRDDDAAAGVAGHAVLNVFASTDRNFTGTMRFIGQMVSGTDWWDGNVSQVTTASVSLSSQTFSGEYLFLELWCVETTIGAGATLTFHQEGSDLLASQRSSTTTPAFTGATSIPGVWQNTGSSTSALATTVTGLSPATKYWFRVVASDAGIQTVATDTSPSVTATTGSLSTVPTYQPAIVCEVSLVDPTVTPIWTDITAYLKGFSTRRGRSFELDRFEAGTATVVLDNSDGRFNPYNPSGPYYGLLKRYRRIRLRAVWAGGAYDIFTGYVERWPHRVLGVNDAESQVTVVDGFAALAKTALNASYPAERSDQRVARVLSDAKWLTGNAWILGDAVYGILGVSTILGPGGDRQIGRGTANLPAAVLTNENALQHLQDIQTTEDGWLFVAANGSMTFHGRGRRVGQAGRSTLATFGDRPDAGELPYVSAELSDEAPIYNHVVVSRDGGTDQSVDDLTSQASYFINSLSTTILADDDLVSAAMASYLLNRYKQPIGQRVTSLVLDGMGDPTRLWPQVLGREIADPITVRIRPPGMAAIDQPSWLEGIEQDWTAEGGDMRTTFRLSPIDTTSYWILGAGALGLTTRLG